MGWNFPSTVFQMDLNRNSNMQPSVVMMESYCLVSGRIFRAFFGYCSLQTDKLCLVVFSIDRFTRFKQLIIQHTLLIPPKTEHYLRAMDIRLCRWFGWLAGFHIWFFALGVVVMDLIFITSNNPMQKWLLLVAFQQYFGHANPPLSLSSCGTQFSCFWMYPAAFKRFEMAAWVTPKDSASYSCVWQQSPSSNASTSSSSNLFGCPGRSSSSKRKSPLLNHANHFW